MKKIAAIRYFLLIVIISSITTLPTIASEYNGPIGPITEGYGSKGSHEVEVKYIINDNHIPMISIHHPKNINQPVPTIFVHHGYFAELDLVYDDLLDYIASWGYAAVFVPYSALILDSEFQYNTMYEGFLKAAREYPHIIDTSKVGFFGHSYGASSIPKISLDLFTKHRWGENGRFIYSDAPQYAQFMPQEVLETYPTDVNMITIVHDDDTVNDHRLGMDIFRNIPIPNDKKDFLISYSSVIDGYEYAANHGLCQTNDEKFDALDYYITFRLLSALSDYTFNGNLSAKKIALGNGSQEQVNIGPLPQLKWSDSPEPIYAQNIYVWPCIKENNDRVEYCCNPAPCIIEPKTIIKTQVQAKDTDWKIGSESDNHVTYYDPDAIHHDRLVVYLTGSYSDAKEDTLFAYQSAINGFHSISLSYPNSFTIGAKCSYSFDKNCFEKVRKEQFFGVNSSWKVHIDKANSIQNRILKLLKYMDRKYPDQQWGQYIYHGKINWSKIVVSGFSQGGGHAAYIGKVKKTERVLMFGAVADYNRWYNVSAPWLKKSGITPVDKYFAFTNIHDELSDFEIYLKNWEALGMGAAKDTVHYMRYCDITKPSNMFFTDQYFDTGIFKNHKSVVYSGSVPLDKFTGEPVYSGFWNYLLGIQFCPGSTASRRRIVPDLPSEAITLRRKEALELSIYPNPANEIIYFEGNDGKAFDHLIVTDISGRIVKDIDGSDTQYIELSDLDCGMYTVHMYWTGQSILSRKIVVVD